jgi:hypothetical protein
MIHEVTQGLVSGHLRSTVGIVLCLLLTGIVYAATRRDPQSASAPLVVSRPDIIFVEAPVTAFGALPMRFPQGSRLVRLHSEAKSERLMNLAPEFFAVADPQISYDGARVLFSGQRESRALWQIWEMHADGSNKHQLTHCTEDCLRASYLPGEEIVFTAVGRKGAHPVSYLAVSNSHGSQVHRITFGPADFQVETVLRDGRILASAPWPLLGGMGTSESRQFYTLQPDGTGLESFRCDHLKPVIQADGEELDDGSIIFVERPRAGDARGGILMTIRRGTERSSPISPPNMLFGSPRRLLGDNLLVSLLRPTPQGLPARFDVTVFNLASNTLGPSVYVDPHFSIVQAVPVSATPVPKRLWSTLNQEAKEGYFISLNSYLSAAEPNGRVSTPIAKVRVRTLEPRTSLERILGTASVEEDGSFYVAVPADQPVRFELLDSSGKIIHAERSWIWARPGEHRGCPGCHSDKALSPANHWPLTLKRLDTPIHLGGKGLAATPAPGGGKP